MKKSLIAVFLFAAIVGLAGEKTVDWVALNGGTSRNIFGEGSNYGTYEDGVSRYSVERIDSSLEVVEDRLKLTVHYSNNSGWYGVCFRFTNACDVTFAEAQQIVVPYKYVSAGSGEVGQRFRLIVGTTTGKKYFGVVSQETIVKGEERVLTFNLADAFSAYSTVYADVKDSLITVMRLYPYNTGEEISASETAGSQGRQNFGSNDEIYIGTFTVKWTDVTGYTASFDANGGNPVEDISTGPTGAFTFPPVTREGWTFMGWYRDGFGYDAGADGLLVMDSEYVAGWRHADLSHGLIQTPTEYRKEIDLFGAWGSVCDVMIGQGISYYPQNDVCKSIRTGVYEVDAVSVAAGNRTNILFVGKGGNSGNNGPRMILPPVGVTVKDAHDFKVKYRTTSKTLTNENMVVYYKVGNTWRYVVSSDKMKLSADGEFNTVRFRLAEALGDDVYEKIRNDSIDEWQLYPYTLSAYYYADGLRGNFPFSNGVSVELERIQLIGEHPMGMKLLIR